MKIITEDEFEHRKEKYFTKIKEGAVFIYPTDTIYGIGCSALNSEAIKKVRKLKERQDTPFSVIAPSKKWILHNCVVEGEAKEWIEKLPGPYTLILKLKNPSAVNSNVSPGKKTLGVRIPEHWIYNFISELDIPILTTSVNKHGKSFMTSHDDIDEEIAMSVDFMISDGKLEGKPSTLVHLEHEEAEVIER